MRTAILIAIAGVIAVTGCIRTSPSKMVLGEGEVTSKKLSVTTGNFILKEGQPGIAFAFATKPGQTKEFTYLMVFNCDFPNGGVTTGGNSSGSTADTFHTIKAFGNECKVEYHVGLSSDSKTVDLETTLIADARYDPSKGKLFLIDMKTMPPTVTQLKLQLPSQIPNLEQTDSVEKFGQNTLNELRKTDKTVDEFCRRIETDGT